MRRALFIAFVAAAFGCHAERLTALDARRAATTLVFVVTDSVVYIVDGVRQPVGTRVTLRAEDVYALLDVKDRATRSRRFGSAARGGLVYITTKQYMRGLAPK